MKNIRIGFKLVAVGTILMIVPLAILAFMAITRSSAALSRLGDEQLLGRSREMGRVIDQVFLDESRFALSMASDADIIQAAETVDAKGVAKSGDIISQVGKKLFPFEKNPQVHWTYEAVIVAGRDGQVFASSTIAWVDMSIADAGYFQKALNGTANV